MRRRTSVSAAVAFLIGGALALPATTAVADEAPAPKVVHRHAAKHVRHHYPYIACYHRRWSPRYGFGRVYLGAYQGGPTYSAAYCGYPDYDGDRNDAAYNGTGLIRDLPYSYQRRIAAGVTR
jgi:hypothetical protein